jgi:hypothetical protein
MTQFLRLRCCFAVIVFAVLSMSLGMVSPAWGQSSTEGAISGVVSDSTGAVLVGAPVTAQSEATAQTYTSTTDTTGRFLITHLRPGAYDLSIPAQSNFAAYSATDVIVEVGFVTTANASLTLAERSQSVTVTASAAPLVNTEQGAFAQNLNTTALNNLPINVRRWSYFALLTPGAVPDGTFGDISFRGVAYMFDNNTVDGASNTQGFFAEEVGRTRMAYSTSLNSVQEFQVNTSDYSAEYGRAVGGVINAVTKSGSNQLHGDLFYYNRDNSVGGAFAPFATGAVLQPDGSYVTAPIKPTDIRQQLGGDAGGWIIKDKLFWYFNFDDQIHHFPIVDIPNQPGNFFAPIVVSAPTSCANATHSGSGAPKTLTTGQVLYCRGITQAETDAATDFLASTTGRAPRTGDQTIFLPKLDFHPDKNNTFSASYNRVRWTSPFGVQTGSVVARAIDSNGNDYVHADRAVASWTSVLGGSTVNELRFVFSKDNEFEFTTPALPNEPVSTLTGLSPQVDINGCGFVGGATESCSWTLGAPYYLQRPAYPLEKRYQVADSLSFVKRNHSFKIGADFTHTGDFVNSYAAGDQLGEFSYTYLQDFLSDYVASVDGINGGAVCNSTQGGTTYNIPCYNEYFQTFGPLAFNVNTVETGLFAQDDWHVTRRLTLNLGLRWDHEQLPPPVLPNAAIPLTTVRQSDKLDLGPRFGIAWDITGHGTTVLRGGAGMFYGRISNEQIYEQLTLTGSAASQIAATIFPTTGSSNSTGTPTPGAPIYPNILPTFSPSLGKPSIAYFPGDFRLPGAEEFDAILEHQIGASSVISVSYIGSIGRFLPIGLDTNLPTPTTVTYTIDGGPLNGQTVAYPFFAGARPNPNYLKMVEYCTCGTSHYNAFVAQFNRHISRGLQFNLAYTYSRDTDDVTTTTPAITSDGPINPFDLALENGTSYLNFPNRFVGSVVWQPPYFADSSSVVTRSLLSGWTISVSQTAVTGSNYNGTISGNEPSGLNATQSAGGPTGGATSTRALFLPKNGYTLPATVNTDLLLGRSFKIHENAAIQFSVQVFNLFNHENYTAATGTAYTVGGTSAAPTLTYNTSFDTNSLLTAANNGVFFTQRQLELGAKLSF